MALVLERVPAHLDEAATALAAAADPDLRALATRMAAAGARIRGSSAAQPALLEGLRRAQGLLDWLAAGYDPERYAQFVDHLEPLHLDVKATEFLTDEAYAQLGRLLASLSANYQLYVAAYRHKRSAECRIFRIELAESYRNFAQARVSELEARYDRQEKQFVAALGRLQAEVAAHDSVAAARSATAILDLATGLFDLVGL